MNQDERRNEIRVKLRTDVYIVPDFRTAVHGIDQVDGPTTFDATTVNISQQGAYLEARQIPKENEAVMMVFIYPGKKSPIVLQGSVIWCNMDTFGHMPVGFGVKFLFINEQQQNSWHEFFEVVANEGGITIK